MNDDDDVSMHDEQASAYLDGELEAGERAVAAADPEAMALVESFSQLRQSLGDVEPVADEVRDSAITAALAVFDVRRQIVATAPVHTARVSVLHTRWHRANRVLGGLAAAALIGVFAVAALNSRGEDAKSSSGTIPLDTNSRIEMATGSATADGAPAATTAAAGTAAPGAATDKVAGATVAPPAINSPDELAQYASSFLSAGTSQAAAPQYSADSTPAEVPMPAVPPSACLGSSDTVLGPITVLGAPAYALRDNSTGTVRAIDASDCHVFFSTP